MAFLPRSWKTHLLTLALGLGAGAFLFPHDALELSWLWMRDRFSPPAAPPASIAAQSPTPVPNTRAGLALSVISAVASKPSAKTPTSPQLPAPHETKVAASSAPAPSAAIWVIPYWIDPEPAPAAIGSERAIALIRQAADSWSACGARFDYQGIRAKPDYGAYGPTETPPYDAPIVGFMQLTEETNGITTSETDSASGQTLQWSMDLSIALESSSNLLAVATHEFGHVLGLDHARDHRSIMFGAENAAIRPGAKDLRECKRLLAQWKPRAELRPIDPFPLPLLAADPAR